MALTIQDVCKLPSLSMATVVSGHRGLQRLVGSVSVLEWMDLTSFQSQYFLQNEIVITSLYSFRHDVEQQRQVIRRLHESGEVGMILYYVGSILPSLDESLIKLSDELEFPIILMPPEQLNLRYSDVIREISELIISSHSREPDFVSYVLERLANVPEMHRSVTTVLRLLADHLQMTLILCDNQYKQYVSAVWPRSMFVPIREILDGYVLNQNPIQNYHVIACEEVNNTKWNGAKLLVIAAEDVKDLKSEKYAQAVQVLELTSKLWRSYAFDTYAADLIAAVINDDQSEVNRLLQQRGMSELPYNALWIFSIRPKVEDYKKRSLLLANQLKHLLDGLSNLGIRHQAVGLIDHIVLIAQVDRDFGTEACQNLSMKDVFALQFLDLASTTDFHDFYNRGMAIVDMTTKVYPYTNPIGIHELRLLEDMNRCLNQSKKITRELTAVLDPLLRSKERADIMIETLSSYCIDCEMDLDKTAEQLFLHRNTVKYRLQKAQDLLGFRIDRYPEALVLYKGLVFLRLIGFEDKR